MSAELETERLKDVVREVGVGIVDRLEQLGERFAEMTSLLARVAGTLDALSDVAEMALERQAAETDDRDVGDDE